MPTTAIIAWLKIASIIVIGFGILIALAALPATAGVTVFLADIIVWPFDGAQSFAAQETRLMSAIGGGVMAGWGALLWLVSAHGFQADPAFARKAILTSVITWFLADSTASVLAGAPLNALFNVPFLLAFTMPIMRVPKTATA